jgi:hypothetical protein
LALSDGIKTYTEQSHKSEEVDAWRQDLLEARRIVFLGFGFHKQNMTLLDVQERRPGWTPRVYATALGSSTSEQAAFSSRIHRALRMHDSSRAPTVFNGTCDQLMKQFGVELSD